MAKIVLDTVTGGYDLSVINKNFDKIEAELQNKVLYRDNPIGEANTLITDVDANGKRIYNLPEPLLNSEPARLQDLQNAVAGAAANLITFTPYGHVAGNNVQAAVQELIDDTTHKGVALPAFLKDSNTIVVDNISALKAIDKTKFTKAQVLGYYTKGDGGGGVYWFDPSDAASADNGGTVIVATDGGRWKLRTHDVLSVKQFGAKGDGVADSTSAIQSCANAIGLNGGTMFVPAGNYRTTAPITIPGGVSILGTGIASQFSPAACSLFRVESNGTLGGVSFRNFYGIGSDATQYVGIEFMYGTAIAVGPRIQGAVVEGVVLDSFLTGVRAKNLWHSTFRSVSLNRCKNSVQILGQCVSVVLDACKITRGVAGAVDGSVGVLIDQSTEYSDAVSRRPEAVRILNETLIFGFDTQVYAASCLVFSCTDNDIDYSVTYGVRIGTVDYGCNIERNWFAGDHAAGGVLKLIAADNLGSSSPSPINIYKNTFAFVGTAAAGATYAIRIGSNRNGLNTIIGNVVSGEGLSGIQYALQIDSAGPCVVEDNYLGARELSLFTNASFGHTFKRNAFGGPIQRSAPGGNQRDVFELNTGSATTQYHGPVTIPAGNTSTTISLASLGIAANPVTGVPAQLRINTRAHQFDGATDRGVVRAYYDGAGNIVVKTPTAVGVSIADVWVDMESY